MYLSDSQDSDDADYLPDEDLEGIDYPKKGRFYLSCIC